MGHDVVAGIYASGTVYALELGAVSDVDAGWANPHAGRAIDAVTRFFNLRFLFFEFSAGFTAYIVVRNYNGVFV
jgi:hypothetical protein